MRYTVVRAVIEHEGKYLLVQHKGYTQNWRLPGGRVEAEEELTTAMERELIEELGVKPVLGKILYIHQLFLGYDERVEFFFLVQNAEDYLNLDLTKTTHGMIELEQAAFVDIHAVSVLPKFLANELPDFAKTGYSGDVRFRAERVK